MADSRLADLPTVAAIGGDELIYLVDDPSGSPADRKATVSDLLASGAVTLSTAQTITGAKTMQPTAAGTTPLIVKGAAGQTANLQSWQSSTGALLLRVSSAGFVYLANDSSDNSFLNSTGTNQNRFTSTAVGNVPLAVRALASQTGDLQQWQNSAGTSMTKMTAAGLLVFDGSSFAGSDGSLNSFVLRQGTSPNNRLRATTATHVPLLIQGAASQTGALQQWQDSAATVIASVGPAGQIGALSAHDADRGIILNATHPGTSVTIYGIDQRAVAPSTATTSFFGVASRIATVAAAFTMASARAFYAAPPSYGAGSAVTTSYGMQIENPATSAVATAYGLRIENVTGAGTNNWALLTAGGQVRHDAGAAGVEVLVIRAAASQTALLTRWENSSGVAQMAVSAAGLLRWAASGLEQTTVGAAGGASALPLTPTKYLKVVDSAGTTLVVPAYAAS